MSAAPAAKKQKKNNSTKTFKGFSIEIVTFIDNGLKYAIVHFPSTGVTPELVCDFWNSILKPNGVMIAVMDTNITLGKSDPKKTPFQVAQEVSFKCPGVGVFVSLMKFGKDRVLNEFRNPQLPKGKLPGQAPSAPDTDGMVFMVDKTIIDTIDFIKTNNEIALGNCSPFCYGNSGGVVNYGSVITASIFGKSANVFTDHAFMKILRKDGSVISFASGAEMFGIGGKTMKPHVSQLFNTPKKCEDMDSYARIYRKKMFAINNWFLKELGRLIKKDIPDFNLTKADQKRMKNLNLSKGGDDFTIADKDVIVGHPDFEKLCDAFIVATIKLQTEAITMIYKEDIALRDKIMTTMGSKYPMKMKKYLLEFRWDKIWGYNLVDAQVAAGFNVPADSPYITIEGFSEEIYKRIPDNGVFLLCECQGNVYLPYLETRGIYGKTIMSDSGDEGTSVFSKSPIDSFIGGI